MICVERIETLGIPSLLSHRIQFQTTNQDLVTLAISWQLLPEINKYHVIQMIQYIICPNFPIA